VQINSKEDMTKIANEVKDFMNTSEVTPSYYKEQDSNVIKNISEYYGLKRDAEYPFFLGKKYKDNTKFELKYAPSNNKITLIIEKGYYQTSWTKYFYYYETTPTHPKNTMKVLFYGIKERIKEDLNDENYRKKYDAEHALKFVEFIERRVFVKREKYETNSFT